MPGASTGPRLARAAGTAGAAGVTGGVGVAAGVGVAGVAVVEPPPVAARFAADGFFFAACRFAMSLPERLKSGL